LSDSSKVDRANAQFEKLQRVQDGKKAMSDYEAGRVAEIANMERLKAMRLARAATAQPAGSEQAVPSAPAAPAKKPGRKKKTAPATLTSWLNNQQGSGRRN
jgi:hypothetical protein